MALVMTLSVSGQYKKGYYDAMDGKKKEALKSAAKQCVSSHTRLGYSALPTYWQYTDVYPEKYNGYPRWWEMYSNEIYLIKTSASQSFSSYGMQREHSVPKSWWKKNNDVEYTPAYTDLWNLYPSDGPCNQKKSNYPFGEVARADFDNGSAKVGTPVSGQGGGSSVVFEPADEYKGDFARSIFYMACVYDDLPWVSTIGYNMFQSNTWPTLKAWAYNMLLDWHHADPVSQKEIDRNNAVEKQQGNRNPFVDFPNLADYVWGNLTNKIFYISEQGGQIEIPGEAEITSPVNGEALDFGQCAVGSEVTSYLRIAGKIKEDLSLRISNGDRNHFVLGESVVSPTELNATGSVLVPILFKPQSGGSKSATMILYDGGLEGSIAVTLKGETVGVPELSRLTAYEATDVTPESYVAHWSVAPEVVDYYVVNRTIYYEDGVEHEEEDATENFLTVHRDANVMETYTVSSSRLGYLSEASNSITVAPGAGIYSTEATGPIGIETERGAFVLITGAEMVDIAVYDASGCLVYSNDGLKSYSRIELPSGMYVLTSRSLNRPFKVLIP